MTIEYIREATISYGPARRAKSAPIHTSADVVPFVRERIADRLVEHFVVIAIDARNRPIAWSTLGLGSVAACPVDVAAVLRFAILAGARAIIVAHNHPSGDASPSPEDIALTNRLASACHMFGVRLLDHVIVAEDADFSFVDHDIMPRGA